MGKKERVVENYLVDSIDDMWGSQGAFCRKYISPGQNGVPDQILFLPRHVALVETKADKNGRVSPLQERELNRIKALGIDAFVAESKWAVDFIINFLANKIGGRNG